MLTYKFIKNLQLLYYIIKLGEKLIILSILLISAPFKLYPIIIIFLVLYSLFFIFISNKLTNHTGKPIIKRILYTAGAVENTNFRRKPNLTDYNSKKIAEQTRIF